MPVKERIAKVRRPSFTPEAVALFVRLESLWPRDLAFKQSSRELARMLGLVSEWWTGNHVNDRSDGPCHPPEYIAHSDWHTCREVREALLAAVEEWKRKEAAGEFIATS
jgi:hypothetical protein